MVNGTTSNQFPDFCCFLLEMLRRFDFCCFLLEMLWRFVEFIFIWTFSWTIFLFSILLVGILSFFRFNLKFCFSFYSIDSLVHFWSIVRITRMSKDMLNNFNKKHLCFCLFLNRMLQKFLYYKLVGFRNMIC